MSVKIRKVGNSTVVTIPREVAELGFEEGAEITFIPVGDGQVLMVPVQKLNDYLRDVGRDVVHRYSHALEKLATYDPACE